MKVLKDIKKSNDVLLIVPAYSISLVVCFYILMWLWKKVCGGGLGCISGIFIIPPSTVIVSVPVGFIVYLILKKLPKIIKKILIIIGLAVFMFILYSAFKNL